MKNTFNIYMQGVGGQGIGLLAETLTRAADYGGHRIAGCDTHGLAQRGGMVSSHLRLGETARSPLVALNSADLTIALERTEALRAAQSYLKPGGTLIWYDAIWQPLFVRLKTEKEVTTQEIETVCKAKEATFISVMDANLEDPRMQNTVLLKEIVKKSLIPQVGLKEIQRALADLLKGELLEKNLALLS